MRGYSIAGARRKFDTAKVNTRDIRHSQGYSQAMREQALKLYVDGLNLRRIGRILDIDHQTVANWEAAYADSLPNQPPLPELPLAVNELDELFTFIGEKKTKRTSSPM